MRQFLAGRMSLVIATVPKVYVNMEGTYCTCQINHSQFYVSLWASFIADKNPLLQISLYYIQRLGHRFLFLVLFIKLLIVLLPLPSVEWRKQGYSVWNVDREHRRENKRKYLIPIFIVTSLVWNRNSSVSIGTDQRLDGWGSLPSSIKRFSSTPQRPDRLWGPPSFLSRWYRDLSPAIKRAAHEAAHFTSI
jgi:hypothetical protein